MNTSGNRVVTDKTNTSGNRSINRSGFPGVLLTEGPCETDVSTYVFCQSAKSVEQYEEIFKDLSHGRPGEGRNYKFVMCRAEVGESGQVKVLGMVQFEQEPGLIAQAGPNAVIEQDKYALKCLLDANSETQFFHEIQDCNVNHTFLWLKHEGTGQIFKHGVFVANWTVEDRVWTSEDEENDQDDMYMDHHLYF